MSNNIASDYYEVTREVYKRISEQFEPLAGELKHIKTIKLTLLLEYIVVVIISVFSNDSKFHKATQLQFKNLNYYIHQNILLLIDVIIERLPVCEEKTEWINNLKSIIDNKLSQMAVKSFGLNKKQQSKLEIIWQNCESIVPIVKNVLSKRPSNAPIKKGKRNLQQTISYILKTIDTHSFMK